MQVVQVRCRYGTNYVGTGNCDIIIMFTKVRAALVGVGKTRDKVMNNVNLVSVPSAIGEIYMHKMRARYSYLTKQGS